MARYDGSRGSKLVTFSLSPGRHKLGDLEWGASRRLRDEVVYAALRFFFYPSVKVANFLRLTPSAVTRSYQRMQERLRQAPKQAIQMKRLLLGQ